VKQIYDRLVKLEDLVQKLSSRHQNLLIEPSSALLGFYGFMRLYGIKDDYLLHWNKTETWRFTWEKFNIEDYFFFGGEVFGEQYGYKIYDYDRIGEKVYIFSPLSMEPVFEFENFSTFYKNYFLKYLTETTDGQWLTALDKFGEVGYDIGFIQSPSELITGFYDANLLMKMKADEAMMANGDVASQLFFMNEGEQVKGLDVYHDKKGRSRIRLNISG